MVKKNRDFVNFCIPDPEQNLTTECTIAESSWQVDDEQFTYQISANRFLRHMVRRLVGSMIQVASGRHSLQSFEELLNGNEVVQKGHSAPPHGLYLQSVHYQTS
jgi:tRNA pseudouridine38-40 synthase